MQPALQPAMQLQPQAARNCRPPGSTEAANPSESRTHDGKLFGATFYITHRNSHEVGMMCDIYL